ncbi:hypothetical protein L4D77_20350 [Photobacterium frigidiphilum]|uniref:hypothetical protein n=1 Tax=Photobacterium frigidiphilum TaxID=264736 RepID=UPI003D0DE471
MKIIQLIIFSISIMISSYTPAKASSLDIVTIVSTLEEIQGFINSTITTVDVTTANKLEDINTKVSSTIKELKLLIDKGETSVNSITSNVSQDIHGIFRDVRVIIKSTESTALNELNKFTGLSSVIIDDIPLIDVEPYISSVIPSRIQTDFKQNMSPIHIYGFLPGKPDEDIIVELGGVNVKAQRTNKYGISINNFPRDIQLNESSYLPIKVIVKKPSFFGLLSSTTEINDNIYIQKNKPFNCSVDIFEDNPNYYTEVTASEVYIEEASTQSGASKPTVNRSISVKDILLATVPNAIDSYDIDTASIKNPGVNIKTYGGDEHYTPYGKLKTWNTESITVELYAPEMKRHTHQGQRKEHIFGVPVLVPYLYIKDAGGTKAVASIKPKFLIAKKGEKARALTKESNLSMGWKGENLKLENFTNKSWSVHVNCNFEDGAEKWSSGHLILTEKDPSKIGRGILATISEGRLLISPVEYGTFLANL